MGKKNDMVAARSPSEKNEKKRLGDHQGFKMT
jgi:hypothetical protein